MVLRRNFLSGLVAGGALALCTPLAGGRVVYGDDLEATPEPLSGGANAWRGLVKASGANVRAAPLAGAEIVAELVPGQAIEVDRWVAGTEVYPTLITWAHLANGRGYVYGSAIQPRPAAARPYTLPPDTRDWSGTWIDVNLTDNLIAACDGQIVRGVFATSPGRPGWETTRGQHRIRSQAPVQDMSGPGYDVRGVRWVSYFLPDGQAIHARTWDLDAISLGVPSSHGCLGVSLDAAAFLYRFGSPGTPVYVHD